MPRRPKRPAARATPPQPGGKRARTRAALVEAAAAEIAAHGLQGASMERIARRAGMSRGAIYGNFRNREEILVAVAASRWRPVAPQADPSWSLAERMAAYGRAVAAAAIEREAEAVGALSFTQYVLTHPPLRRQVVAANTAIYGHAAQVLAASRAAEELRLPAERFVRIVHALADGLIVLHALTPELIPPDLIQDAFALLAPDPNRHTRQGDPA